MIIFKIYVIISALFNITKTNRQDKKFWMKTKFYWNWIIIIAKRKYHTRKKLLKTNQRFLFVKHYFSSYANTTSISTDSQLPICSLGRQGCIRLIISSPYSCSIVTTWSTLVLVEAFAWPIKGFFSTLVFCSWKVSHPESSKDCTLYLSAWQFSIEWLTSPPWYSHFALTS